jgi:16S rRNA (cytidine1402-2'-O)-methyltransferase
VSGAMVGPSEGGINSQKKLTSGLYIVGTPIGNLEDISARAIRVLARCGLVAAEDTRRVRKLLNHFGIKVKTVSYREQNRARVTPLLLSEIRNGGAAALVSDAGMPVVSDPGAELVNACASESLPIYIVPGPCAVSSALALSGLPGGRFRFLGYPPARAAARRRLFEEVKESRETLVLFEAPHRILTSIEDMVEVFGDREAAVVREMTKVHEEVLRGRLSKIENRLKARESILGEFTLVVAGASERKREDVGEDEIRRRYRALLAAGEEPKEAVKLLAGKLMRDRRELYRILRTGKAGKE